MTQYFLGHLHMMSYGFRVSLPSECYDPVSDRVVTSRHVYFDERCFLLKQVPRTDAALESSMAGFDGLRRALPRRALAAPSPAPAASSEATSPGASPFPMLATPATSVASPASLAASPVVAPVTARGPATCAHTGVFRPSTRYPDDEYVCTTSIYVLSSLTTVSCASLIY